MKLRSGGLVGVLCCVFAAGCFSAGGGGNSRQEPAGDHDFQVANALPGPEEAKAEAPQVFRARFATTKGDFVVEVQRRWAPNAADRFFNLVQIGYFRDIVIFRAIPGFMFQFGIHGDPAVNRVWGEARFADDNYAEISNEPGMVTFARTGAPNSRSVQMFVNTGDNNFLDRQGFTPFGKVVEGMDVVNQINCEYGENSPEVQGEFTRLGNNWVLRKYPNLDLIRSVTIEGQAAGDGGAAGESSGNESPGKDGNGGSGSLDRS